MYSVGLEPTRIAPADLKPAALTISANCTTIEFLSELNCGTYFLFILEF